MTQKDSLQGDETYRYALLDRHRSDCEYYLGHGNRYPGHLWGNNEVDHIANMKALWKSFPEDGKPEWLPYDKILEYESKMCPKAILVERDYKGEYERFALTPDEFREAFCERSSDRNDLSLDTSGTFTVSPLVHISYQPCVVGDGIWQLHFHDMAWGLPESDIENGNLAFVRPDKMLSLKQYLPEDIVSEKKPSLDSQILAAQKTAEAMDENVISAKAPER